MVEDCNQKHGGVSENGRSYSQFRPKETTYTDHDDLENEDGQALSAEDGSMSDTSNDPARELCVPLRRLQVCQVNIQGVFTSPYIFIA